MCIIIKTQWSLRTVQVYIIFKSFPGVTSGKEMRESFPGQVERKSRGPQGEKGLQMEEIACKCQTFLSLLSGRRKQISNIFFLLYTNLKRGFS